MSRYWVKRENATPVAAQDFLTVISGANRRLRILDIRCNGVGASSAPQSMMVARAATGTTPGGAITPSKADNSDQPASNFTTATTWAAQPTPEANGIVLGWNALGGMAPWTATQLTRGVLEARNGETISFRPGSGPTPQAMSLSVLVEED